MIILNRRGQALVEFIIILPIVIMIIMAITDFGKIIYKQNVLENKLTDVVTMYNNEPAYEEINQFIKKEDSSINLEIIATDEDYLEIVLHEDVSIITPGLNLIIGNPYIVKVKRVIKP